MKRGKMLKMLVLAIGLGLFFAAMGSGTTAVSYTHLFFHWSCISRISISISSFKVVVTSSSSLFIIFTSLDVLAAYSMGISLEASIKRCISSSVNPVVPQTSAFLWKMARERTSIAISFVEKSIMTSQPSITLSKSSVTGTPNSRPTMATVPRSCLLYTSRRRNRHLLCALSPGMADATAILLRES